jgi:hypothetical protein
VIKKEKSKMGSTGNKRKIVTPTDILDRNANFYNPDIERLLEGLPGSEFCADYVFYDLRGNGASHYTFVHEAKVRKEKETQKKKRRAKENEVKATEERDKERKRKVRDDERDTRKKQKMSELDQQKQARQEERLARLSTQVDERLFKEACFQRERVVLLASKLCGKEIARRKKASEVIAVDVIENSTSYMEEHLPAFDDLPPLAEKYDLDIVRIHDFLMTYRRFFEEQNVLKTPPSLDELQRAVKAFSTSPPSHCDNVEALALLNDVAVALCKPVTASLIKTLTSALTTSLQDRNGSEETPVDPKQSQLDPDDFMVTRLSWKEVMRLFLLSDALSDLGLTKIEQTHVLRGYRSGGHPNSKEAKRIRRGEDSALVLRRQGMIEHSEADAFESGRTGHTVVVPVPCKPSANPSDWTYFLHNIKALPSNAATGMKANLQKACKLLKSASNGDDKAESMLSKLK